MSYGQRLTLWRKRLRLRPHQVCEMTGCPPTTIHRIENDHVRNSKWSAVLEAFYADWDARLKAGHGLDNIRKVWA